ncbi:DUF2470 domain-containing protein [Mycobacterium sp. pUA109]|uniref:DUF2470 domain-containing protein n=1 Tax=Mycobacterium sp. pUA109 TaxID=3238982 RepID=UPI00351B9108
MSLSTGTAPTTAERIRSACVRADGALLAIEGYEPVATSVHHLLGDGSYAVAVPADGALAANIGDVEVPAMLELTDYAPLPLREPVRALVWLRGRLRRVPAPTLPALLDRIAAEHPHPALLQVVTPRSGTDLDTPLALLRLEMDSVVVADATGAESVGVDALLSARPDPFCAMETCWLQHLEQVHPDVIARLASRLPGRLRRGQIRPLGLDRYGVRLRVEGAEGDHDVRLPFPEPVDDITGLGRAIRVLMGCPFLNGLRARRL